MRLTVRQPAPHDATFAAEAFAGVIGKEVPFNAPGYTGRATVTDAAVIEQGRAADLTLEVNDRSPIAAIIRDMPLGARFDGHGFEVTGWDPAEHSRDTRQTEAT